VVAAAEWRMFSVAGCADGSVGAVGMLWLMLLMCWRVGMAEVEEEEDWFDGGWWGLGA
jgi:hypothetical protein